MSCIKVSLTEHHLILLPPKALCVHVKAANVKQRACQGNLGIKKYVRLSYQSFSYPKYIIVAIHFWFFSQRLTSFKGSCWATSTIKSGRDIHGSEKSTAFLHIQKDQITARCGSERQGRTATQTVVGETVWLGL